jgi:hypothetical protein
VFSRNRIWSLIICGLVLSTGGFALPPLQAAIIYVDKDNACPGAGTSESPYCSIQNAFNAVAAGDTIRLREAASPYNEKATVRNKSGTATHPIIVEPDIGQHPILRYAGNGALRGAIEIRDADYWIIRNLVFDGAGLPTSAWAIALIADTRHLTGHQIVNNTIRNWGDWGGYKSGWQASAITLRTATAANPNQVMHTVVRGNTLESNTSNNIKLLNTRHVIVENNVIQNTKCGRSGNPAPHDYVHAEGIKVAQGGTGAIIRNNLVRNFERSCAMSNPSHAPYTGIYCDTGPDHGEVYGNTVHDIFSDVGGRSSQGIFIESGCDNWKVYRNVVYNIGKYGLRNSSKGVKNADHTQWLNNTVVHVGQAGLVVFRGHKLVIKNNIFVESGNSALEFSDTAVTQGPHVMDHNLYWDAAGGSKVARWGNSSTLNFASWRAICGCDGHSLNVKPRFVSTRAGNEDFQLQPSSPARGAGEEGRDMGILQQK